MKIFRNGEAFELTFSEIIQAHEEYELECAMEDVRSMIGPEHPSLSDNDIKSIATQAMRNLNKNDSYYESYWLTVKYTLDDYINNLSVDKEED